MAKTPFNRFTQQAKRAISKIGDTKGITDRTVPSKTPLSSQASLGDNRSQVDTYFTTLPAQGATPVQIYTGDRYWATVKLTLETAGPVAVGTNSKVRPVLGGGGRLLITGQEVEFRCAKGTKLYVAATGVNRIGRVIEPIPWLEQLTGLVATAAATLGRIFASGKGE